MSFFSMFLYSFNPSQAGFEFMWIILAGGVFATAISIERFIFLNSKSLFRADVFVRNVIDYIEKDDVASSIKLLDRAKSKALSQVLQAGVEEISSGAERIRNSVDEATMRVIPQLEKRTSFLGTIGNIATLLGLMGTIYGLIIAFAAVGKPGIDPAEKSTLLAQGIAAAMNTTYLGLLIAIPCITLYTIFRNKTQSLIDQIDQYSLKLVNVLVERSYRTHKYHIKTSDLKDGVGLHVTHNNIKIFTDNKLIKEISI